MISLSMSEQHVIITKFVIMTKIRDNYTSMIITKLVTGLLMEHEYAN